MPRFKAADIENDNIPHTVKALKDSLFSKSYNQDQKQVGYDEKDLDKLNEENRLNCLNDVKDLINNIFIVDEGTEFNKLSLSYEELKGRIENIQSNIDFDGWVKLVHGWSVDACRQDSRLYQGLEKFLQQLKTAYAADNAKLNEARLNNIIERQTSKLDEQNISIQTHTTDFNKMTKNYQASDDRVSCLEKSLDESRVKMRGLEKSIEEISKSKSTYEKDNQLKEKTVDYIKKQNALLQDHKENNRKLAEKVVEKSSEIKRYSKLSQKLSNRVTESLNAPNHSLEDSSGDTNVSCNIRIGPDTYKELNDLTKNNGPFEKRVSEPERESIISKNNIN